METAGAGRGRDSCIDRERNAGGNLVDAVPCTGEGRGTNAPDCIADRDGLGGCARFKRLFAVPAAVLVTMVAIVLTADKGVSIGSFWPHPIFITPVFTVSSLIGIAVPLFIVTMASQNIPGMAVLALNEFRPDAGPLFTVTGFFSLLAAPFGGHW